MSALTVVAAPVSSATPLYAIEEYLAAMVDTVDMVSDEEQKEFLAEFQQALTVAVDKRDRVGQFLTHLETQAALAKAEIDRLQKRKALYERAYERMEAYLIKVIESLGKDEKDRYRKLEGKTVTFSVRHCPASVHVYDEALVPSQYKIAEVKLPAPLWEELMESIDLDTRTKILDQVKAATLTVSCAPVKAALNQKEVVPGARLIEDKLSLRVT
jgi:hypothetical protein